MEQSSKIGGTDSPTSPAGGLRKTIPTTTRRGAREDDPYAQAGSEIVELVRVFVEAVGTRIREAQWAAKSARADRAAALRIRYETIKLRAETEAEAARIVNAARDEADRTRKEAHAETAEFRVVLAVLGRAHERLAEVIERLGNGSERTTETVVVIPDAPPEKTVTES